MVGLATWWVCERIGVCGVLVLWSSSSFPFILWYPLITGKKDIKFGSIEDLPFRLQDLIDSKDQNGEPVVYSEHYVNNPETPHLSYLNNKAKQDVLDQDS